MIENDLEAVDTPVLTVDEDSEEVKWPSAN